MKKINVAVVGMRFGREFVKIYQKHPCVANVAICRRNTNELDKDAEEFGISKNFVFNNFDDVLNSKEINAVHLATPIEEHFKQSVTALSAGKHVACAVPAATSISKLNKLAEAAKESKKIYMMIEPAVYSRYFLYVKNLADSGKLGKIQFLRGYYFKNMEFNKRAGYWLKTAPLMYSTHAAAPLTVLSGAPICMVTGFGSGTADVGSGFNYGSPYSIETMNLRFKNTSVSADVMCSLYGSVRQYKEGFDVYGSEKSFEWKQLKNGNEIVFNYDETADAFNAPDTDSLLIDELKEFTVKDKSVIESAYPAPPGNRHGGSYPHLVQAFISSITENKQPLMNISMAANITAAGILGHKSCVSNGKSFEVPVFEY